MGNFIRIGELLTSVVLIGLILLQQRGGGLSSTFGGLGAEFYGTRRGIEKFIFILTIIFASLFIAVAALGILVH